MNHGDVTLARCWFNGSIEDRLAALRELLTGDDAIFSLTLDLATYFGEIVRSTRPEWRWGLDLTRSSLRGPMLTSRRIILCTAPLGVRGIRVQEDWEAVVVLRYRKPAHFLFAGPLDHDSWLTRLRDGCSGRVIDLYRTD
ncbi:MAG: hypothetical protein QM650_01115 [Microlunatus sp.]